MEAFTVEQQAYLDSIHTPLLTLIDALDNRIKELWFSLEGVKAILAFKRQVATMEELEDKARELRVAADLMKLSDPRYKDLEELKQRIKQAGDQGPPSKEG